MNYNNKNNRIYSLKGMKDYLPKKSFIWNFIFNKVINILNSYGFNLIKFPIIEKSILFNKTIGNNTDIINKEMYSFIDKNLDNISLRPDGTSCCVRFGIENGLLRGQKQKWWYFGPMFRHEKPQLCRYREFYQLGIEAFGYNDIYIELELILLVTRLFKILNINNEISLEINSIGSKETRIEYSNYLLDFFNKNISIIDKKNLYKIKNNPLKLLDTKNIKFKNFIVNNINTIENYLDKNSIINFNKLKKKLIDFKINYKINPFLIRGIDYYNNIVFEWKTNKLGSQSAICAGGRYDNLVYKLGGINTSGVGLAIGWDRLIELFSYLNVNLYKKSDILLIVKDIKMIDYAIEFSEEIRNLCLNISIITDYSISSINNKIKFANNNNISYLIIINDITINNEIFIFRDLKKYKEINISKTNILKLIKNLFI